jgi:hypothetical protein
MRYDTKNILLLFASRAYLLQRAMQSSDADGFQFGDLGFTVVCVFFRTVGDSALALGLVNWR